MNIHKQITDQRRPDAIAKFKAAQKLLSAGRRELIKAQQKIDQAQTLVDESAEVLRATFQRKPR